MCMAIVLLFLIMHTSLEQLLNNLHPSIEMTVSDRKVMLNYLIILIYLKSHALKHDHHDCLLSIGQESARAWLILIISQIRAADDLKT